MGVTATTRLPAGWYPDPDGGDQRRWWDGREWTQYTAAFQRPTPIDEPEAPDDNVGTGVRRRAVGTRIGRLLAGAAGIVPGVARRRGAHRSGR